MYVALVAAGDAVAPADPRGLDVRGARGQRIAFPFTRRETFRRRERVGRRLRTAVHPDRDGASQVVPAQLPRDHVAVAILFAPDRDAARPILHDPRRLREALPLNRGRQVRRVRAAPCARLVAHRHAGEVAEVGAGAALDVVLVEPGRPRAGEVHLRRCGQCSDEKAEEKQRNLSHRDEVAEHISFPKRSGNGAKAVCYISRARTAECLTAGVPVGRIVAMKRYLVAPLAFRDRRRGRPGVGASFVAATYLENQTVTIEGELVQFVLRNPHSFVDVDVAEKDGSKTRYVVEWAAPAQLAGQGGSRKR